MMAFDGWWTVAAALAVGLSCAAALSGLIATMVVYMFGHRLRRRHNIAFVATSLGAAALAAGLIQARGAQLACGETMLSFNTILGRAGLERPGQPPLRGRATIDGGVVSLSFREPAFQVILDAPESDGTRQARWPDGAGPERCIPAP